MLNHVGLTTCRRSTWHTSQRRLENQRFGAPRGTKVVVGASSARPGIFGPRNTRNLEDAMTRAAVILKSPAT
jgi:hypothetical protein